MRRRLRFEERSALWVLCLTTVRTTDEASNLKPAAASVGYTSLAGLLTRERATSFFQSAISPPPASDCPLRKRGVDWVGVCL